MHQLGKYKTKGGGREGERKGGREGAREGGIDKSTYLCKYSPDAY